MKQATTVLLKAYSGNSIEWDRFTRSDKLSTWISRREDVGELGIFSSITPADPALRPTPALTPKELHLLVSSLENCKPTVFQYKSDQSVLIFPYKLPVPVSEFHIPQEFHEKSTETQWKSTIFHIGIHPPHLT